MCCGCYYPTSPKEDNPGFPGSDKHENKMTGYKNGDSVGYSDVLTCGIVDSSYRYQFQQLQSGTEIPAVPVG